MVNENQILCRQANDVDELNPEKGARSLKITQIYEVDSVRLYKTINIKVYC